MSDHQQPTDRKAYAFVGLESAMLGDVIGIAERALWDPATVPHHEVQQLAAAVVAHVRRLAGNAALAEAATADGAR